MPARAALVATGRFTWPRTAHMVLAAWMFAASANASPAAVPTIFALQPDSGPSAGGTPITISGAHLLGDRSASHEALCRCRFGAGTLVSNGVFQGRSSHGTITCTTPRADAGYEVAVEVSCDGGATETRAGFRFRYYHEAVVSSLSPRSGPATGGTLVDVTGYNFAAVSGLECAFGWRRSPATLVDFQHVRCVSPAHSANG